MTEKLEEFIKSLLEEDPNLENEIENLLNKTENESDFFTCSFRLNDLIITPTTTGLSFLANYNFLNIVNMLIPDLFLECTTLKYPDDILREIILPRACPIYTSYYEVIGKYGNLIDALDIDINIQKTIDLELIKSFFYFNFTSDYTQDSSQVLRLFSLEERVKEYLLNKPQNNSSKYTDPQVIFSELYSSNSLLIQIIEFSNKLNEALGLNKNGTNICQYNIPWLFTFNCIGNDENIIIPYNSFNSNKSLYSLEYSDMFYLSNIRNTINTLLETVYTTTNNLELVNILKKSNIFIIIDAALAVYNNILVEISYILTNKIYVKSPYQNIVNLFTCLNLYYNYVENEIFLNQQIGPTNSNSNSFTENDKNILLQLEKIIASFNNN